MKIGTYSVLIRQTIWIHWRHFQQDGLADQKNGRPQVLDDAQPERIISDGFEEFSAMRPMAIVDVDHCRCPFHQFTMMMTEVQEFEVSRQSGPEFDTATVSDDRGSLPFWVQAMEE
jgi:hypothetical protein